MSIIHRKHAAGMRSLLQTLIPLLSVQQNAHSILVVLSHHALMSVHSECLYSAVLSADASCWIELRQLSFLLLQTSHELVAFSFLWLRLGCLLAGEVTWSALGADWIGWSESARTTGSASVAAGEKSAGPFSFITGLSSNALLAARSARRVLSSMRSWGRGHSHA